MTGHIVVVGVGLIGGSLGLALRERHIAPVVGVGRADDLAKAERRGAIDRGTTDLLAALAGAETVVLATPIGQILADLDRLASLVGPGIVVTDVGSTKAEIVRAGDSRFPGGNFVGGHPLAGSERSGVEAARADLFTDATWVLTPTAQTRPDALEKVRSLAQRVGARVITLDPEAHDRAVAVTSHLPHFLAYALAALGGIRATDEPHLWDLAAGSWAGATRVAASPPALWREIALTNRAALLDALREFGDELSHLTVALETADGDALEAAFNRGYQAKRDAPLR